MLVLLVPYSLYLVQYPALGLMFSIDAHRELARIAWIGSALNLVLSIVLGLKFGLMGVVWATVVDLGLVYGLLFPRSLCRATKIALTSYVKVVAAGAAMHLVPAAAYYLLVRNFIEPDYFRIGTLSRRTGLGVPPHPAVWGLSKASQLCSEDEGCQLTRPTKGA